MLFKVRAEHFFGVLEGERQNIIVAGEALPIGMLFVCFASPRSCALKSLAAVGGLFWGWWLSGVCVGGGYYIVVTVVLLLRLYCCYGCNVVTVVML